MRGGNEMKPFTIAKVLMWLGFFFHDLCTPPDGAILNGLRKES